ncbi:mitogen-activated protein kinase-binding protein 1-like isoform X2 [Rhopilema esculentum]|uniref:mitogen-activated protein kinase-binding protein 1-like isoform X2 n=1 Tax=Rhopilema esculentum TaxID=499914 RepID=UPI0031D2C482
MRRSFPATVAPRGTPTRKLVRKSASAKDIRCLSDKVSLERVLGLTSSNTNGLTCNPYNGMLAYPAGCVIVLFNSRTNSQSHIFNPEKKTLTALAFSSDGKYLASGESGHNPRVRVWELGETINQVAELNGHKFSINCVAFSPNLKYLVSIGDQHDMMVNVWNWRTGSKVACNKIGCKVRSVSFAENGSHFVTVGNRHVKFWYFDTEVEPKSNVPTPVAGRSGILGDLRNNCFCDVACGIGDNSSNTYAVTKSGLLCSFNEKRILDRWVELRSSGANSIVVNEKYLFCGCTDGIIRVFHPTTMHFVSSLPKPHFLGVDVAAGLDASHMVAKDTNVKHPDVVSLALDNDNDKLSCIYNDHSLYVWDIQDVKKVGKACSFLYHSACIWGVETYPVMREDLHPCLPSGSFLTCSSDDTIRVWNIETGISMNSTFPRNIYSKELLKIIYTDEDLANIQDISSIPVTTSSDMKTGVRCLQISPDGQLLAAGDRSGNLRVYDLQFVDEIMKIEAHEAEILCVEFSDPKSGYRLLATSSRDRLIHIFDIDKDFALIQTIDDHASSVTAVRMNYDEGVFQLLSCGADKHIMLHTAQKVEDGKAMQFVRENTIAIGKATLYDMDVDPTRKLATTCGQDRNVRVYDIQAAKQTHCYKGAVSEDGTLIKIQLDPSGVYAATSCSDKSVNIYDFEAGECVAVMYGHSELVTGLKFTADGTRLISVSGDHCIFVWRLVPSFTQAIVTRLLDLGKPVLGNPNINNDPMSALRNTFVIPKPGKDDLQDVIEEEEFSAAEPDFFDKEGNKELDGEFDYRFSVGQLPAWAQKQIKGGSENTDANQGAGFAHPSGRWAQRVNDAPALVPHTIGTTISDSNASYLDLTAEGCTEPLLSLNSKNIIEESPFQRGAPYSSHQDVKTRKSESVIYIPSNQDETEAETASLPTSSLRKVKNLNSNEEDIRKGTLSSIAKIKRKIIRKSPSTSKYIGSKSNTVESPKTLRRASKEGEPVKSPGQMKKVLFTVGCGRPLHHNMRRNTTGSMGEAFLMRRASLPSLSVDKVTNTNKHNTELKSLANNITVANSKCSESNQLFEVHFVSMEAEEKILNEKFNINNGYGESLEDQSKNFQVTARASLRRKKSSDDTLKNSLYESKSLGTDNIKDNEANEVDLDSMDEEEDEDEDGEELTDSDDFLSDHAPEGGDDELLLSLLEQHFDYLAEDMPNEADAKEELYQVNSSPGSEQKQKKGQGFLSRCRSSISAKFLSRSQKTGKNSQISEDQKKRIDMLKRVMDQNQNYGSSGLRAGNSKEAQRMKKLMAQSEPNLSIGIAPQSKTGRKTNHRRGSGISADSSSELRVIKEKKIPEDDFQSRDRVKYLRASSTSSAEHEKSASELINLFNLRSSTPKHKLDLPFSQVGKPIKSYKQRSSPGVSPVSSPTKLKQSWNQLKEDKTHEGIPANSMKEMAVKRRPKADDRPRFRSRPKSLVLPLQTSLDELIEVHCSKTNSDSELNDDCKLESKKKAHTRVDDEKPGKYAESSQSKVNSNKASVIVRPIEIEADDSLESSARKSTLDNTVIFNDGKNMEVANEAPSQDRVGCIEAHAGTTTCTSENQATLNVKLVVRSKEVAPAREEPQREEGEANEEAKPKHDNEKIETASDEPSSSTPTETGALLITECQAAVSHLLASFDAISSFQEKVFKSGDVKNKDEIVNMLSSTYCTVANVLTKQQRNLTNVSVAITDAGIDIQAKQVASSIRNMEESPSSTVDKTKQVVGLLEQYSDAIVRLVEVKLANKS